MSAQFCFQNSDWQASSTLLPSFKAPQELLPAQDVQAALDDEAQLGLHRFGPHAVAAAVNPISSTFCRRDTSILILQLQLGTSLTKLRAVASCLAGGWRGGRAQ